MSSGVLVVLAMLSGCFFEAGLGFAAPTRHGYGHGGFQTRGAAGGEGKTAWGRAGGGGSGRAHWATDGGRGSLEWRGGAIYVRNQIDLTDVEHPVATYPGLIRKTIAIVATGSAGGGAITKDQRDDVKYVDAFL